MNRTVIVTTIRERFSQTNRWFGAAIIFALPLIMASVGAPPTRSPFMDVLMIWLVGAGIIGEDISTGTIMLVLSRPVRRWEYVLSKWLALSVVTAGLLVLQAVLGFALAARAGAPPALPLVLATTGQALLRGVGAAAVLMPFSVAIAGGKELSAIALSWALGSLLEMFGKLRQEVWMEFTGHVITRFLLPSVDFAAAGAGLSGGAIQAGVYLLTVIGALSAAILLLERRELSYSAG